MFFRKTTKQLEAGLWMEAKKLYRPLITYPTGHPKAGEFMGKARIKESTHDIYFPSGARIQFSYMERDQHAEDNLQG